MTALDITILGLPQISFHGQPLILQPRNSTRAKAILYYLAATGRPETRERLAGLLWSDWPEKKAREYLRGELFLLRPLRGLCLNEADGRLALNPQTSSSDLALFRSLTENERATLEELDSALRLWTGSFLQELESAIGEGAALYGEWLQEQRSHWQRVLRSTRYRLAELAAQSRQGLGPGIAACTQLLRDEPEREEVHRLKMRLLALAGQRTAALKQYDECTTALLDELGVLPSAETNALYDQILAGEVGGAFSAGAPAVRQAPYQAPVRVSHFVGREQERTQLSQWLAQPQGGAVTAVAVTAIVGMGGSGKTTLAAEVVHQLRDSFPDGVLWGRVSNNDPLDILQSWALAFDKDLSKIASPEARAAAMRSILAGKRALIVLDDLVAGRAVDLLLPSATCSVLITTRDWAEVAARTTQIVELAELSADEGLALLASYLGEEAVQADQRAAAALCSTLGGLPLAVEIAAQRVFATPRRSLSRMVHSLQAASGRLAHGISNRSVRTSFDASWEALGPQLQRLFALTGVFDGRSFAPAALAAVAAVEAAGTAQAVAIESRQVEEVVDQLEQLATLSMLKPAPHGRYIHHRLLADYAAEKLAEQPDATGARLRFALHCRTLLQETGGGWDALGDDWDALLAGIAVAHQHGAWLLLAEIVDGLVAPWFARARFAQALPGFLMAIDAATALRDEGRRARYAYFLAKVYLRQDNYAAARQLLDSAISVFEATSDQPRLADAYVDLADVALEEGNYLEATADLELAETFYRRLHQPVGVATVKCRQALIAYDAGDDANAQRLCEEGLHCLPPGDGAVVRSRTLRVLTDLALRGRQFDQAAEFCQQAVAANQNVNDQTETAAILYAQAKLDHYLGNPGAALPSAQRSAQLYAAMGDRKAVAIIYHMISLIHMAQGEAAAARAAAEYSLDIAHQLHDADLAALCRSLLDEVSQPAA